MGRRALCIHGDVAVRSALADGVRAPFTASAAATSEEGEQEHAREPFDVVLVELDPDAAVVRRVRSWHPQPAVVAVATDADHTVEAALTAGAHDHLPPGADPAAVATVVERSWRRHRADRTSRAEGRPRPDLDEVRRRVAQLASLTAAAKDLLDIDEPPHTTVRSLLEQAGDLGEETVELTSRAHPDEERTLLDLPALVAAARRSLDPDGTTFQVDIDPVEVHGHPAMLRTALVVLLTHALRDTERAEASRHVHVDTLVLDEAVHLRVHDDGPSVRLEQRPALLVGGGRAASPRLMAVEHVAARHGGTAWLADSDVVPGGTMAVIELPLRALPR